MKIGVIIPDRGDRPEFLRNCIRMMEAQKVKPSDIYVVGHAPTDESCDITKRYRIGYEFFRGKGFDLLSFIENDDAYTSDYFEVMSRLWLNNGSPDIFGTNYTIYYHLKLNAWHKYLHDRRASAMNTFIKPDLDIEWCSDSYPYTDLHLWSKLKGIAVDPGKLISIGMKHGTGMCGGAYHTDRLNRFVNNDSNKSFLKRSLDTESFKFYSKFSNEIKE